MQLSIVATLYRTGSFLADFHARATAAARSLTDSFEIVLVNDGSPDDALALALTLAHSDPKLRIVDLSRNFGHHPAMWAGLAHATGDLVFLIDSDLEERPEWLGDFNAIREQHGADVVFGVQEVRG